MNPTRRRLLAAALLLTAAFTLTAGSCKAAFTLRQAQDEYNAGVECLAKEPSLDPETMKFPVGADPRTRFQSVLDVIDEGQLTSSERPGHLRMAALTLQGYSHYALYRLTGVEAPKTGDEHYAAALKVIDLRPEYYNNVADLKKPIVRREDAMLRLLKPLLRMEYVFQKYDEARSKRPPNDATVQAATEAYKIYREILQEYLDLREGGGIPRSSPVAAELVILSLDAVQGAYEAYSQRFAWGSQPDNVVLERKKDIELKILGPGLALVKWYTSTATPGAPADIASIPGLAPKFGASHEAVKQRWMELKSDLGMKFGVKYWSDMVWEAP